MREKLFKLNFIAPLVCRPKGGFDLDDTFVLVGLFLELR
jgi:hypothetical protein